jgi:activator of HSP90 ATPase
MATRKKYGTIQQTIFLNAKPEEVYTALLDAEKHSEFTGSPASTSARVGAEFQAWDGYISGKNLELVKNKKIVQEWETTEWPSGYPRSRLELILTAKKGGTELTMIHSRVPAGQTEKYESGWRSSYWQPLEEYFAQGPVGDNNKKQQRKRKMKNRTPTIAKKKKTTTTSSA